MPEVPIITAHALIDRYDALLLDAYGVLVSLDGALPGAATFIDRLNALGKPYWVVSNTAARLPANAACRYRAFGLEIAPERILTSGGLLAGYFAARGLAGRRVCVLGPEDSVAYVRQAGGVPVAPGEDFEVLVLADQAGFPLLETVDTLLSALFDKFDAGQSVPMILPNPDLVYPRGRGWGITSGSVAQLFEAAVRLAGTRNLAMLGDQLETDIRGARAFGIDSVLMLGGVAGRQPALADASMRPDWLMTSLGI